MASQTAARSFARPTARPRCAWAAANALLRAYHDREWGVPVHNDRRLFEFLILQGMQAGLSWEIILRKRPHLRRAFHRFDPRRLAAYTGRDVRRLLGDPEVIRNRQKITAAITNARRVLEIQREFGSLDRYLWAFVGGRPIRHRYRSLWQIPATTAEAEALSRDLRRRGMTFVGPIIVYAFMQAVGMVNDHTVNCFRYRAQ